MYVYTLFVHMHTVTYLCMYIYIYMMCNFTWAALDGYVIILESINTLERCLEPLGMKFRKRFRGMQELEVYRNP